MRLSVVCVCLSLAASAYGEALSAASTDCVAPIAAGVLTLPQASERFSHCNAVLEQARAATDGARGDLQSASHRPNPTVGLSVSNINPQAGMGSGPLWNRPVDSTLRLDQLLERGGKLAARRDTANGALHAANAQLEDVAHRGQLALIEAYVSAAAADDIARLLGDAASSYRDSLNAMYQRLGAGDVASIEVERTALDAARAATDADAARIDRQHVRADLALAMGVELLPDAVTLMSLEAVTSIVPPDVRVQAAPVSERPDLRAAAARVDASTAALRLAQAARKRDVDVSLGFDHWPANTGNAQGTGNSYTIGVSVPLFLFDSGRGGVSRATADLRSAKSDLNARSAAATLELQQLTAQLHQTEELATRYTQQLLPAAERILQAEEAAYRRGAESVLNLLDARRSERQVAVAAVNAQRDAILYRARLAVAAGYAPLEEGER